MEVQQAQGALTSNKCIMNRRLKCAYIVLFACLFKNGRRFESFRGLGPSKVRTPFVNCKIFATCLLIILGARSLKPKNFRTYLLWPKPRKGDRVLIIQNGGPSRSNTQTTEGKQTSIFYS